MRRKKIEILIISILTPLLVGFTSSILSNNARNSYMELIKPPLSPPGIIFPIVWTILYILMGIASYFIFIDTSEYKNKALQLYRISLIFNFFWSIIFFRLELYLLAFVWLLVLIYIIINMIILFYKIKPLAAYLLIPYLVWCLFAAYLNLGIYILNR
jgi:benzodiazapine receptor